MNNIIKVLQQSELNQNELLALCERPKIDFQDIFSTVEPIIVDVRRDGDNAIRKYTKKFDGVDLESITIDPQDVNAVPEPEVKEAIDRAMANIHRFHAAQQILPIEIETEPGVVCQRVARPVESVGLYIPGGTAPLPSTAMMLAVPAMIAGCKTVVLATPPDSHGDIPATILYIAQKTGVSKIIKAGGAQAIAGMAFGTESIPKVDKIFGPGNQFVTAAKMVLQNSDALVAIDLPAGPSEVLVIADEHADPAFIAADLLSQAEHGSDSQSVLVLIETADVKPILIELKRQLERLPRKDLAGQALSKSFILIVPDMKSAINFSNHYAPEHLIIQTENSDHLVEHIDHAGSIFLGPWTPESMGDYASGTNHTLPTYGYAKMYSGVSLLSFQKFITVQKLTETGLRNLGPAVEILADIEGLDAHKKAVSIRLKKLSK